MSAELAVVDNRLPDAPTLADATELVDRLVREHDASGLGEARIRAEALGLYAKRQENLELERRYAQVRFTIEAGLGVLSYADPSIGPNLNTRGCWRALAAAYERGRLEEVFSKLQGDRLSTTTVVARIRREGYTWADGKPWVKVRGDYLARGVDLTSIPPDVAYLRHLERLTHENSKRNDKIRRAVLRKARMNASRTIAAEAAGAGTKTSKAYSHLRRTLQALHDAQAEFERGEPRSHIECAIHSLYRAEESIGNALGLEYNDEIFSAWSM